MEEKIRENNEELENIAGGAGLDEMKKSYRSI